MEGSDIEERMENLLDERRRIYSEEMTSKEYQIQLQEKVRNTIASELNVPSEKLLGEENFNDQHQKVIARLINDGLWPAPGGAWCSTGIPVYKRMVSGGGHPLFDHFDVDGNDVTHMANLDCQSPFYFVFLETGEFNRPVIDFWSNFLLELQQEYNFDAYRIDHIDHIVDRVSQDSNGTPISYRAPAKVLAEAIYKLRERVPYFGTLAEYMLWEDFYKEYHQDMGFDLLWGADIVFQYDKKVQPILNDNHKLNNYNSHLHYGQPTLSILKTYNNQDGEFKELDQYPGQMGETGALFKWLKLKFLPFGPLAERPAMFIDGDESFTKTGIEYSIGIEASLKRNNNKEFFRQFTAINNFALNNILCRYGLAEIHHGNEAGSGLIAWTIKKLPEFGDDERLMIVANEFPPHEILRTTDEDNNLISVHKDYQPVYDAKVCVPDGFIIDSEYILPEESFDFIESTDITNLKDCILSYNVLNPSEFHIYKLKRP